jgi:hypothetical protein
MLDKNGGGADARLSYDGLVFAYVVTSYTNPDQTARLLRRLRRDSPSSRIIVSHDRKALAPSAESLAQARAELWLTPEPVSWGDATYLRSVLAAIHRLGLRPDDWVTVITGQDYPVRPLRDFETHLASCGADMALEETEGDPNLPALLERYLTRAYRLPHWVERHRVRQVVKHTPGISMSREPRGLPPYLLVRRVRTPFSGSFRLYKGCDLFALSGRASERLLAAPPALLRYFAGTRVPSEAYVHTVLRNDPALRNDPGMLHYARWEASPHPSWLSTGDLDAMLTSGKWFARKFRQDDAVLDLLDDRLDRLSESRSRGS